MSENFIVKFPEVQLFYCFFYHLMTIVSKTYHIWHRPLTNRGVGTEVVQDVDEPVDRTENSSSKTAMQK